MKNNDIKIDLINEINSMKIQLKSIESKIDELLNKKKIQSEKKKSSKPKLLPLTEIEITNYKELFSKLYNDWIEGREINVTEELEKLSPDELRRFADANNLNVTSKMAKDKVLNLISLRFREKKMMITNYNVTKPLKETLGETKNQSIDYEKQN